ncbi:MAG: hypothetical protein ACT4OZ_13475 [Gemmatimonadota bacterium]
MKTMRARMKTMRMRRMMKMRRTRRMRRMERRTPGRVSPQSRRVNSGPILLLLSPADPDGAQ